MADRQFLEECLAIIFDLFISFENAQAAVLMDICSNESLLLRFLLFHTNFFDHIDH